MSHLVDACTAWLRKRVGHVLSPEVSVACRWGGGGGEGARGYCPITWDMSLGVNAA